MARGHLIRSSGIAELMNLCTCTGWFLARRPNIVASRICSIFIPALASKVPGKVPERCNSARLLDGKPLTRASCLPLRGKEKHNSRRRARAAVASRQIEQVHTDEPAADGYTYMLYLSTSCYLSCPITTPMCGLNRTLSGSQALSGSQHIFGRIIRCPLGSRQSSPRIREDHEATSMHSLEIRLDIFSSAGTASRSTYRM
ncbi:hypothetical protein BZA05DRAFT_275499 [Tricharina praecox]|uniref:uncharacterized protein n=1 Tax=Tricharina praecox TaxID=43433 RepID=UPI00221E96C3|nr:uncharacterized protein BZA05DRAFT_275499 [Tricharina praecox]KAI5853965.1 hypothetical protein BZA05DRAFT_275499 [Tricharina praecox]